MKQDIKSSIDNGMEKELKEIKREWKHLIKFKDENYLLFTAFVILLAGLLIVNTVYILNRGTEQPSTPKTIQQPVDTVVSSLETGMNAAVTAKVSNVTENDQTDYAFAAEPDSTMLILTLSITNNTNLTQQLIPVNQLYVRSNEGDYATLHASMYVKNPLAATDLAPGKTAKGEVSFSVPKHVAHPLLYVDTLWNNATPIVIDVLK